jgi:hypothetical protein
VYSCEDVLSELGNYLDDEVAADVLRELESHMTDCKTCTAIYDSARKTLKIITDSSSFELPQNLSEPLVARIMSKVRTAGDDSALEASEAV